MVATLGPVGAVESAVLAAELLGHVLHFVPESTWAKSGGASYFGCLRRLPTSHKRRSS